MKSRRRLVQSEILSKDHSRCRLERPIGLENKKVLSRRRFECILDQEEGPNSSEYRHRHEVVPPIAAPVPRPPEEQPIVNVGGKSEARVPLQPEEPVEIRPVTSEQSVTPLQYPETPGKWFKVDLQRGVQRVPARTPSPPLHSSPDRQRKMPPTPQ